MKGFPLRTEALPRTTRLVTTARLRESVLRALIDTDEEFALLAALEGATSARLNAASGLLPGLPPEDLVARVPHAAVVNAAFAYARPRGLNRFNGPERGAWYAALAARTALAEVAFHLTGHLAETGVFEAEVDYVEMHASFAGAFLDLRGAAPRPACLDPDPAIGYPAGNALAVEVMAAGHNGILYPSVRDPGGTCLVALWPHAVQSPAQGAIWRLRWSGRPTPHIEQVSG
ncbi:RES family NAD+ phosphorylase [Falsiroseomonas tokyonensis]|uniref:RES family NAD+ phosphorylase n=1 Tax=Falsiroseomonas tokyonensis TaxID=430521 RepID=A0ABV7BNL6_9PROT|nr:RES family NAD+ phosphorylase [Falsiroseomonas tokyonensis]